MTKVHRRVLPAALLALAMGVAACGSDEGSGGTSTGSNTTSSGDGASGGKITVLVGTAPDHLDPHLGYTTQAASVDWLAYTGLLTYAHESGADGSELIPGLATELPTVSEDGKTYTLQLRDGLKYSDGTALKPDDFEYSVERMLRLPWGGSSFVTNYVKGAADYQEKKAKDISGITATDDGKITIKLSTPYGAFANVLAFPALGLVPSGTPMKDLSADPPAGIGAYKLTDVVPNQGHKLVKVPGFADFGIPDIPTGTLDEIDFKIVSNTQSEAQQVLDNSADVFDAGDTLPPSLLPQINSQAADRFAKQTVPSTFYMFLNTTMPPFDNEKARQAVNVGVDRRAFERLSSGFMKPECYFIPEGIAGHPDAPCKYGTTDQAPDLAKAKQLLEESGQADVPITVWGQRRAPRTEYVNFYTSELKKIGFTNVKEKIIADETYFPTVGNAQTNAQTGFADWIQDFPNPSDFFLLLDANSIADSDNVALSEIDDPKIQSELKELNAVPASELDSVADRWAALDEYAASKGYNFVYGSEQVPQFYSERVNFADAIFHSTYFTDWSTLALK